MMLGKLKQLTNSRFLAKRLIFQFVKKETDGKDFETVVDIGAGKSPYRKLIHCDKYIAVDVEDRRGAGDVVIADVNKDIPLENNITDLVLMTEVLEHIKEPRVVLAEVYRILKPGGKLILTTPFVWPEHEAPNDFYRYTKYGLEYLLRESGYNDIKIEPKSGYFLTMCQLTMVFMRKKIFIPVVFFINAFAMTFSFCDKRKDFPLGYNVAATKK